jgi:hypothetical protein
MEQVTHVVTVVGSVVASILLPLIGVFLFYDSKKRKEKAEADKAETDNINSYAEEWKALYNKKEDKVKELETKIDILYDKAEQDRNIIRDLREENFNLKLEKSKYFCDKPKCPNRNPPNNY